MYISCDLNANNTAVICSVERLSLMVQCTSLPNTYAYGYLCHLNIITVSVYFSLFKLYFICKF